MLLNFCLPESYSAHFASPCVILHVIMHSYPQLTPSLIISAGICQLLSMPVHAALNYRLPPRRHHRASPMHACTSIHRFGASLPQIWHVGATRLLPRSALGAHVAPRVPFDPSLLFYLHIFTPIAILSHHNFHRRNSFSRITFLS